MIDTHAHLNFSQFDKDRKEVISECLQNNIAVINVGIDYQSSKEVIGMAEEYEAGIYASIGLHPLDADQGFDSEKYKDLNCDKVVAVGETGLDYWYKPKGKAKRESYKEKQKEIFVKQVALAEELDLPLIIHCRVAFDDAYDILKQKKLKGVLHCFTGSLLDLERFLDLGYFIGVNGIIFKMDLREVIEKTPLNRILLETDCPFLSPPGFDQRNSPLSLKYIGEEVARIKNIALEEVLDKTQNNAKVLFNKL